MNSGHLRIEWESNAPMEIIEINHNHPFIDAAPSSVALGNFDGVHLGHQKVIARAKEMAYKSGLRSGVMTFYPHPKKVIHTNQQLHDITPISQKLKMFEEMGLDLVYMINFDRQVAGLSPDQFIERYIISLRLLHVVVGFDFFFGRNGSGETNTLKKWSDCTGKFGVHVIPSIKFEGNKISSTRIREYIKNGKLKDVKNLMGRPYQVEAVISPIQSETSFTLCLSAAITRPLEDYLLPKPGVYAVEITWKNQRQSGLVHVGMNPALNRGTNKYDMEVFLSDFDSSLYGECVTIHFLDSVYSSPNFGQRLGATY
jgi:riboflavin kinase/FMN adenylyltransferase